MKCNQILQDNFHEKYLLNELSPDERQAYEAHLNSCTSCTDQLKQERALIAGIRSAAKLEMKAEVKRRAEEQRCSKKQIDWTLLYKAAAVLAVLALLPGISYYYWNIESPYDAVSQQKPFQIEKPVHSETVKMEQADEPVEYEIEKQDVDSEKEPSTQIVPVTQKGSPQIGKSLDEERQARRVSAQQRAAARYKDDKKSIAKGMQTTSRSNARVPAKDAQRIRLSASKQEPVADEPLMPLKIQQVTQEESIRTYRFVPTVSQDRYLSKSIPVQEFWRFQSDQRIIKARVELVKDDSNDLEYVVLARTEELISMDWKFYTSSSFVDGAQWSIKLHSDTLLHLFKQDTLLYKVNLNERKGRTTYLGSVMY